MGPDALLWGEITEAGKKGCEQATELQVAQQQRAASLRKTAVRESLPAHCEIRS
jgi:hypothetical protein